MAEPISSLASLVKAHLTDRERDGAVAYAIQTCVPAGTSLVLSGITIQVTKDAYVVFVDRDPLANWSHASRYLLIERDGGGVQSFEAQFPPFPQQDKGRWHVVHRAPSVPDSALMIPP